MVSRKHYNVATCHEGVGFHVHLVVVIASFTLTTHLLISPPMLVAAAGHWFTLPVAHVEGPGLGTPLGWESGSPARTQG